MSKIKQLRCLFLFVCLFFSSSSCSTIPFNDPSVKKIYYSVDGMFDKEDRQVIRSATRHFSQKIDCYQFELSPRGRGDLRFTYMWLPIDNKVGLYHKSKKEIELSRLREGKLPHTYIQNSDAYFFKIIIHELAHFVGMPIQHAFPDADPSTTQLSPYISDKSDHILYEKDIEYLKKIGCQNGKESK